MIRFGKGNLVAAPRYEQTPRYRFVRIEVLFLVNLSGIS